MLNFTDQTSYIVALRNIHRQPKYFHTILWFDLDSFLILIKSLNFQWYFMITLLFNSKMDRRGVLVMIYHFRIIIFYTHIGEPISCIVLINAIFILDFLKAILLLPSRINSLIPYICLNVITIVIDLLMNMGVTIMTDHIYV